MLVSIIADVQFGGYKMDLADKWSSLEETADYLDVTEEFLKEALAYYKTKYGDYVIIDNYTIFFEPHIAILELK